MPSWRGAGSWRSRRALIIGVSVSDTKAEIRIATASVMANSWNRRPTTSPMNSSGISTAISDTVSEMMVKPICLEPFSAACMTMSGLRPGADAPLTWPAAKSACAETFPAASSRWREMFSIITMASSTTKPVEITSAISVRLLIEKPAR